MDRKSLMNGSTWDLKVLTEGDLLVLRVQGQVDVEAARQLLDLAASVAANCRRVQIDLDRIESLSEEAAALLLFRQAPWHQLPETITLRTAGRPSRQAVLRAYARRRTRTGPTT
jgi:anti-anti-sigma regulatory factor